MKKIIYLFLFLGVHVIVFSQQKLRDGIYLIDQSANNITASQSNKALIQFNPLFVEDDPEVYGPIVIFKDDFVPLELSNTPIVQYQRSGENLLLVHLTENATEKLTAFTTMNMMNHIVVVVNGEAIAIYKVIHPVTDSFIKITKCNSGACNQIFERLKTKVAI
jgi:hypothetical protein